MSGVELAIQKAGSLSALARLCGVYPGTVYAWRVKGLIPLDRVAQVASVTGIGRAELRPDVFGAHPAEVRN